MSVVATKAITPRFDALTDRQREVWEFMVEHLRLHGLPPTVRKIGGHFGIASTHGATCHLKAMAKKGVVTGGEFGTSHRWMPVLPGGCCPMCGAKREVDR